MCYIVKEIVGNQTSPLYKLQRAHFSSLFMFCRSRHPYLDPRPTPFPRRRTPGSISRSPPPSPKTGRLLLLTASGPRTRKNHTCTRTAVTPVFRCRLAGRGPPTRSPSQQPPHRPVPQVKTEPPETRGLSAQHPCGWHHFLYWFCA